MRAWTDSSMMANQNCEGKRYVGSSSVVRLMAHRCGRTRVSYTENRALPALKVLTCPSGDNAGFVMDYDRYEPRQLTSDGFQTCRWSPDRRCWCLRLSQSQYAGYRYDRISHRKRTMSLAD